LEARARRLGIAGQVRWLGFQPNPYSVLRAADCFALSSDYEGLPNALIESLACGTPVISTAAPYGPEEIVQPGQNGWLTPVGDAEALADALERLADSPEDQRRMSEAAPASIWDRFEPNQILDTYERLIHETVQEHQLRSGRSRVG
jgi:glycosyltransferase involved in cell wall biosynthesis